jgi:hypothetical protein
LLSCDAPPVAPAEDRGADVAPPVMGAAAEPAAPEPMPVAAPAAVPVAQVADAAAGSPPPTPADAGTCPERDDPALGILVSPERPAAHEPVRFVAATLVDEAPLAARLETREGAQASGSLEVLPGVPSAVVWRSEGLEAGAYRFVVGREGRGVACAAITVQRAGRRAPPEPAPERLWRVDRRWSGAEEALYSTFVRALFHAPRDQDLAYRALHELTGDPTRNLLFDHFRWGEDSTPRETGLWLQPDCADTAYFLRAYFAWRRHLPFALRQCSRGAPGRAPRCGPPQGVPGPWLAPRGDTKLVGEVAAVQRFFERTVAWGVHTGNGRTALGDDRTDFYPVMLQRRGLRPGVIYADPYGHVLVVVELMAPEGALPGVLWAIDGQPDGSITRKRFWEGNFLWNSSPEFGGTGFKAFRPVELTSDGAVAQLGQAAVAARPDYADVSLEQGSLDPVAFYDRMDALVTPGVRDPHAVQRELVRALGEAARVRVTSIANGEEFHRAHPGRPIEMPSGFQVFETTGPWEDYSTPARDLRLLVAIDVVQRFAEKVRRRPETYGMAPARMEAELAQLAAELRGLLHEPAMAFSYRNSRGDEVRITLQQLIERAAALEAGYNPNDCPEVRWGASGDELATCTRRAPADQQRKMEAYRVWFRERRRPARGDPGPPWSGD